MDLVWWCFNKWSWVDYPYPEVYIQNGSAMLCNLCLKTALDCWRDSVSYCISAHPAKNLQTTNPDVFISSDGGYSWRKVRFLLVIQVWLYCLWLYPLWMNCLWLYCVWSYCVWLYCCVTEENTFIFAKFGLCLCLIHLFSFFFFFSLWVVIAIICTLTMTGCSAVMMMGHQCWFILW